MEMDYGYVFMESKFILSHKFSFNINNYAIFFLSKIVFWHLQGSLKYYKDSLKKHTF